jgi:hypothetical protein
MKARIRNFLLGLVAGKLNKGVAGIVGGMVTWSCSYGFPLDTFISDSAVSAIGSTVTAIAVYAIKNYT